jgi:hypothetical protein
MFTPVSQGNIVMDPTLYAFYDFGDPASYLPNYGTTVYDLGYTKSNNGTLVNGPVWNNTFGGCIQYDGADDNFTYTGGFSSSFTITLGIISTNANAPGTFWANDYGGFPIHRVDDGVIFAVQNIAGVSAPIAYLTYFGSSLQGLGDSVSSNEGTTGYCTFANVFSISTNGTDRHIGYMNNFQRFNNTNSYTTRGNSAVGTINLGYDPATGRYPIGRLLCYMHYNRELTPEEVYQNHQYFNNKWLTKTGPA